MYLYAVFATACRVHRLLCHVHACFKALLTRTDLRFRGYQQDFFFFVHPSTGRNAHMSGLSCVAHYLLLIVQYSLFVAYNTLLSIYCLSCIAQYLLPIMHCSLSVAYHALLIICCLSCIVHSLLPAIRQLSLINRLAPLMKQFAHWIPLQVLPY